MQASKLQKFVKQQKQRTGTSNAKTEWILTWRELQAERCVTATLADWRGFAVFHSHTPHALVVSALPPIQAGANAPGLSRGTFFHTCWHHTHDTVQPTP